MKTAIILLACLIGYSGFAQTQAEMSNQEAARYKTADAGLNREYKKLVSLLRTTKEKQQLLKAQRAWISFRDAHCAFVESPYQGGSMQPMIRLSCLRETTEERTAQLQALIADRQSR